MDENNEEILIQKAKQGNLQAFSLLIKMHQERAARTAYSFVGNREDAYDIAQEAFVKAYEALSKFKGGSKFSTWLYRIIANVSKDFLRKKNVRAHLWINPGRSEEDSMPDAVTSAPSPAPDALYTLMSQELGVAIQQAMEELPFQQKSVFALRYLEGLSLDEIAEALELTTGAVKAHLWQAGQKMKKSMSAFMPGQGASDGG